jgi:hypothetical protein
MPLRAVFALLHVHTPHTTMTSNVPPVHLILLQGELQVHEGIGQPTTSSSLVVAAGGTRDCDKRRQ